MSGGEGEQGRRPAGESRGDEQLLGPVGRRSGSTHAL